MPDYAGYEPFEEFHRGPLATVWKARRGGAPDGECFALKVSRPPEWLAEHTTTDDAVSRLLECAAEMQQLGAAAPHWVPVLASGRNGTGAEQEAFWVTRFYPRSLERVIDGRAQLTAFDIHWIVSTLVRGLIELETALGRPHGNLEPNNIFLDGDGRISAAVILLSDLWPRSALALPRDRTEDFHAVGRIVVHLVRREGSSLQTAIGWPLEPGPEWRRLGRTGDGWRELCNLLLKPEPAPDEHDWAAIARRIEALRVAPPRPWVPVAISGGVLAILLGGGFSYLRWTQMTSIPTALQDLAQSLGNDTLHVEEAPEEWSQLCNDYYNWLGTFERLLADRARLAAWETDAQLRDNVIRVLRVARDRYDTLDPRRFAGLDRTANLVALRDVPPDEAKRGLAVIRIPEIVRQVKVAQAGFAAWDTRATLEETANRFDALGWTRPAAELREVLAAGASGEITAENIDAILRIGPIAARAVARWSELENRAQALAADNDPVMSGLRDFLASHAASSELDALERDLDTLAVDSARWIDWVQGGAGGTPKFDRERFARESALRGFSGPLTTDVLQTWEREVAEFAFIEGAEDPRQAATTELGNLLRDIDESLRTIGDEVATGAEAGDAPARLRSVRETVQQSLDELLARRIVRRDLPSVGDALRVVRTSIDELARDARETLIRIAPDPAEWLQLVARVSFGSDGAPLEREWRNRRTELLGNATVTSLGADKNAFRQLRARYITLERFFRELGGDRGIGTLPRLDTQDVAVELRAPLETWAAARAQGVLEAWLSQIPIAGGVPQETTEVFLQRPGVRAVVDRYTAALRDAARMAGDFTVLRDQLQQVELPDETSGRSLANAAASAAQWGTHAILNEIGDAAVFRSLLDAAGLLGRIDANMPRDALIEAAGSPWLGIAWVAWRQLGAITTWPAPADLEVEARLQSDLRGRVERIVTRAERRAPLLDELTREAGRRWRVAWRAALDDSAIERALALREAFGVREEELSGAERLNVELHRLKHRDWGTILPDDISAARDDAVRRLSDLAGTNPQREFSEWLQKLLDLELIVPKGEQADVRKLGPGQRGWTGEVARDPRQVDFRWTGRSGEHRLTFWLIERPGFDPFFLSATELPVGLLVDLVAVPQVRAKMTPWLLDVVGEDYASGNDQRMGPQSWRLDSSGSVRLNTTWTPVRQPSWPREELAPLYPEDLSVAASPDADAPVNYIPPRASRYLAEEVLGCRLPTPEEWQALAAEGLLELEAVAGRANRRDDLWLRERDYLLGLGVLASQSPVDADIFWPRMAGTLKRGSEAQAAVSDRSDGALWFEPVDRDGGVPIRHLLGNVAEFLFDEANSRYYVAGSSALSPPELDPAVPYPIEDFFAASGFCDVGLRLAFSAPGAVAGRNRLIALIRNQPYVRF